MVVVVVVVVVVVSWRCEVWSGGGLMEFGRIVKATVSADGHVPLLQSLFFCLPLGRQAVAKIIGTAKDFGLYRR